MYMITSIFSKISLIATSISIKYDLMISSGGIKMGYKKYLLNSGNTRKPAAMFNHFYPVLHFVLECFASIQSVNYRPV
jgi:hypothetical protein